MKVLGVERLQRFSAIHVQAAAAVRAWLAEAREASWRTPHDIKSRYSSASFVGSHVIFNLRGNRYRLDVQVSYASQIVSIVRAGTHAEYDKWSFPD